MDFVDERDRGNNNRARWHKFCKSACGGVHNYANGKVRPVGSNVGQEILGKLRTSCEQFGNEIRAQLNSLNDAPWGIVIALKNMAKTVGRKLTGNEEISNKQDQVLTTMYTDIQKII